MSAIYPKFQIIIGTPWNTTEYTFKKIESQFRVFPNMDFVTGTVLARRQTATKSGRKLNCYWSIHLNMLGWSRNLNQAQYMRPGGYLQNLKVTNPRWNRIVLRSLRAIFSNIYIKKHQNDVKKTWNPDSW